MPIDLLAETGPQDLLREQLGPYPGNPKTGFLRGVGAGAVNIAGTVPSALGGITGMSVADRDTGLRGASLAAEEYAGQIYQGPTVDELLTDPSFGKTWDFVKGEVGKQVAPMAASLALGAAGAKAGAALPLPPHLRPIAAAVGGVGGMAAPFFGWNIGRQTQEQEEAIARGEMPREYTPGTAALAAPVQAAAERFALGKVFKGTKLGELMGETGEKLSDAQLDAIAGRGLLKTLGAGAARTLVAEIPVEIGQQALERAQAGLEVTGPEAAKEYRDTAISVLAGATPIGAGAGVVQRSGARAEAARRIEDKLASTPLKEELAAAKAQTEEALADPEKLIPPEQAPQGADDLEAQLKAGLAKEQADIDAQEAVTAAQEQTDLTVQSETDRMQRRIADVLQKSQVIKKWQETRMASDIESTDARVEGVRLKKQQADRQALMDAIYADPEERTPGLTFLAALEREYPNKPYPTPQEKAIVAKRESVYQAINAPPETIPSLPNEMPADIVPATGVKEPGAKQPRIVGDIARGVNDVLNMWKGVLSASEGAMTSIKPQHIAAAVKGKTTITEQLAGIATLRNKKSTGTDNKALLDQLTERLGKFKRGVKDAVQEPSATKKISPAGETGENIPNQGAGVRQEEQGAIPAQEAAATGGNAPTTGEVVSETSKPKQSFALPSGGWGAVTISQILADAQAGKPDAGIVEPRVLAQDKAREEILATAAVAHAQDPSKYRALTPAEHRELVELRDNSAEAQAREEAVKAAASDEDIVFSANIGAKIDRPNPTHTKAGAKAMVENIMRHWTNPPVVEVYELRDLSPKQQASFYTEAEGVLSYGAFFKNTGTIWIISDLNKDMHEVKATLLHESLGHYGLATQFRRELNTVLAKLYHSNAGLRADADILIKATPTLSPEAAVEEVLAISQEAGKKWQGPLNKLVAWIRSLARKLRIPMAYSKNDVVAILRRAHDEIVSGKKREYVAVPAHPEAATAAVMRAVKLGFKTPESAARVTDAVLSKAVSVWDNIKPTLQNTYLNWSQMTHIADMTENLIPMLKHWGAEAVHPVRDKTNNLLASGAIAKELTHAARAIYHQMEALAPKQKEALFSLTGKYQLLKIFPNMEFKDHSWLTQEKGAAGPNALDRAAYREAKQLYDQPGVAKVYDAAYKYNQRLQDTGMASLIKNMGQVYGAPESLWRAITTKEGMDKNVIALLEYAGVDSEGKVLPDEHWAKLGVKKPTFDYELQDHIVTAMGLHQAKKATPYFSLGRDGDYLLNFHIKNTPEAFAAVQQALSLAGVKESIVVNPGDTHVFSMFETESQMRAVTTQLAKIKEHLDEKESTDDTGKPILSHYTAGLAVKKLHALDGSAPSFIRGMLAKINEDVHLEANEKAEHQELLRRLYINMLPESSVSKFYMRRAGTPGYSSDMARSFVKRAAAGAYFVAQHATRPEQTVAMARLRETIAELGKEGSPYFNLQKQTDAVRVLDELNKRTANTLTPLHTPALDRASAIGHTFFLSANIGFVLQNLAQPYQLSLPKIGGRHGFFNSTKAMIKAGKDAGEILKDTLQQGWQNGKWMGIADATITIDRATHLSPGDRGALLHLIATGRADWTQAAELTKIAEGANRSTELALKLANSLSHYGEILNRMQTGLAAYRLEMKRSNDTIKAHAYMVQMVDDTQINYATENRSRAISKHGLVGEVTPVATLFMQYSIGVVHLLTKLAMQAHSGGTVQERKEAAKSLMGILVATGMAAGTLGLPFAGVVIGAYNALAGDEDEPPDAKADYQNFLTTQWGADAAQVIAHGPLNYITGAEISSKLGQQDVLPFSRLFANLMDGRMSLRDRIDAGALSVMGPVIGGGSSVLQGLSKIADGHTMEGLKQLSPGATKGPFKALDLYNNGFTNPQGIKLPMEATSWDMMVQFVGFTPTKQAIVGEAQRGFDMKQRALSMRSSELAKRFVKAVEEKDVDARLKVMEEALTFMRANPGIKVDFAGALRRRAQEAAIAKATGSGVIGSAKQVQLIREQTEFAQQP